MSVGKGNKVVGVSHGAYSSSGRYCRGPMVAAAAAPTPATTSAATADAASDDATKYTGRRVVLTREEGKNGDMMARLVARGVECVEMPLIETAEGPDRAALPAALVDPAGWTWVCVTSPEAAKVFLEAWREAGSPPDLPVATVGAGTAKIIAPEYALGALTAAAFTPSKANADTLVAELPLLQGGDGELRVLYPASAKAASTRQDGLAARGAAVTRLNTYSTEKVTSVAADVLAHAKGADVVTFGSPSAVKAWVALSGLGAGAEQHPLYACIGGTSAKACNNIGLPGVLFPENPGLDGWEGTVLEALDSL
jgi:uroporphyrinogen-III synthase